MKYNCIQHLYQLEDYDETKDRTTIQKLIDLLAKVVGYGRLNSINEIVVKRERCNTQKFGVNVSLQY